MSETLPPEEVEMPDSVDTGDVANADAVDATSETVPEDDDQE